MIKLLVLFSMLGPLQYTTPQYEVAVEEDVVYTTVNGYWNEALPEPEAIGKLGMKSARMKPLDLDMDIYVPEGDLSEKRPLLMLMHGGAFFVGSKTAPWHVEWCRYFASLGYVAVSVNYRLGFKLVDKKEISLAEERALEDADTALAFLLARKDLRIDADRIFVAGTSAGAMTALRMAFRPRDGHPRIRAIGNLWGAIHDLSLLEQASVPILSFQSVRDPVVPYAEGYVFPKLKWLPSKLFYAKMYGTYAIHQRALELGIRSEHHPVEDPRHHIQYDEEGHLTPVFYEIRDAMALFFAQIQ